MKKIHILGLGLALIISACNTGRTDEENMQKLLDRQSELKERQEESVDRLKDLKDSLDLEKRSLIEQRDSRDRQIGQMEDNQQMLVERLKEEEASDVESEKNELQMRINEYEDSIRVLKEELNQFNTQLDSVEKSMNFYEVQEDRTEQYLESGIKEIDQRMTSREKRKQQEIKSLDLLRRRALVADKKIEAYNLEKQMYVDQKDELLRAGASEEEKAPYLRKIRSMDSTIMAERDKLGSIEKEIRKAEAYISETDALMQELQAQVQEEYDKNKVIESFIISEKERLSQELEQIQQGREDLLAQQSAVSENLSKTEQQISQLEKDAELIRNKEMSSILEMQAEIEASEADLAQEEIKLLEEGQALREGLVPGDPELSESSDTSALGLVPLLTLVKELDSLDKMIQEEKAEIAKTRQDLARKRAEAAEKRANFGRTAGTVAVLLVIAGIALLTLFFYLGKKYRAKKS